MGIFVKQFSLIFPDVGGIDFPAREFCFQFVSKIPQFSPNFPRNSPEFPWFPNYSYWSPLIPQFPVQFSIQLHKCTLSLSIRPILCIIHVSLKMRIPHYARQRIINLENSGEIQGILGKSDEKLFIFFHLFSQVWNTFPSWWNLIRLISPVATMKTGENFCEKKWKEIHREKWIPFHFISPSSPTSFYCTVLYVGITANL